MDYNNNNNNSPFEENYGPTEEDYSTHEENYSPSEEDNSPPDSTQENINIKEGTERDNEQQQSIDGTENQEQESETAGDENGMVNDDISIKEELTDNTYVTINNINIVREMKLPK